MRSNWGLSLFLGTNIREPRFGFRGLLTVYLCGKLTPITIRSLPHLPVMKESQIRPRVGVNLRIFSVGALDNSTAIGIAPHRARRTHPTATHTFAMPTATLSASASLSAARSLASTRAAVRTSVRRVAARSSRPGSIRGSRSRSSSILTMAASASDVPADAVEYFSPSKVNLFLRVVRRRDDGYHDLASLFHVIDLGDDMKFAKSTGSRDTLVCSDDTIPLDSSTLVITALDVEHGVVRANITIVQPDLVLTALIVEHGRQT